MIDLKKFRKFKKLRQSDIAKILDIDQSRISKYESGKEGQELVTKLLIEKFTDIENYIIHDSENNAPYDINIIEKTLQNQMLNILHIPLSIEYEFTKNPLFNHMSDEVEKWCLPGLKGKCYSFVIHDDTMNDTFRAGELIVTSREEIQRYNEIIDNSVYVIVLKNELLIKRVIKRQIEDSLILVSDNHNYDNQDILFSDIKRMYKARRHISFNLSRRMKYD